jgi:hypothetical protein
VVRTVTEESKSVAQRFTSSHWRAETSGCLQGREDHTEGFMKVNGLAKDFIIVGENIHTTRVVLRNGSGNHR